MKILAIETSCDETAAAVVEDGRTVLSNIVASQVEEHIIYGGVVPEIASRRHIEAISGVVDTALKGAECDFSDLDAIAVTHTPGLIGALLVGVNYAKGLSYATGLPLIPVHHLRSHIAANYIAHPKLEPPFLSLVVSGGHSHIIRVDDYTCFETLGRTRDDAAGEAMDKVARALGLPYPGGLNMDRACSHGNAGAYKFPYPRVEGSEYDFSFSGLKTAALNQINSAKQKGEEISLEDFGASYMKSVTVCLVDNTLRAARDFGFKKLVLAGGVSANSHLRRGFEAISQAEGYELFMPQLPLCCDNAAMVGSQAFYEYKAGNFADLTLNACATSAIEG
ncbi:MAG: tRNA (adenosine(37)-N6)-threonylcarbamoyltransferase complex transferase subunit TsaD [Clostridiales bacterium]|nr:tRNA (adenosine(37)-N6)-threonylcarbamoyltransferase complex transferase subunit TsaD [Clostridiales bacterium]